MIRTDESKVNKNVSRAKCFLEMSLERNRLSTMFYLVEVAAFRKRVMKHFQAPARPCLLHYQTTMF